MAAAISLRGQHGETQGDGVARARVNTSSRLMREGGALGELVVDHIANEAGCRFEAQFVEHATFVGADRLGAQVQFGSDLAGAPACGKRQQDFVFLG